MEKPRNIAKESVIWLLQDYSNVVKKTIDSPDSLIEDHDATKKLIHHDENEIARYYISYLMSLIHISPKFANGTYPTYFNVNHTMRNLRLTCFFSLLLAVWRDVFCILYEDNRMGNILLFERRERYSYCKTNAK